MKMLVSILTLITALIAGKTNGFALMPLAKYKALHMTSRTMKTSHRLLAATSEGGESTNEASIADECVRAYFQAWNTRDMESAVALFSDDTIYEDTQYSKAFEGKTELRKHLNKVANALPKTFEFVVDATSASLSDGSVNVGVQWHVENDGSPLPFTRGCSMYVVEGGEIISGFDVPEPAPFKQGNFGLGVLSVASKLIEGMCFVRFQFGRHPPATSLTLCPSLRSHQSPSEPSQSFPSPSTPMSFSSALASSPEPPLTN